VEVVLLRVARQCNAVYCCRCGEGWKENDMRSVDGEVFLAAVAAVCATVGQRVSERESACGRRRPMSIPAIPSLRQSTRDTLTSRYQVFHLLTALTPPIFPSPHMRSNHTTALSFFSLVGTFPFSQGCPADCSSSQVLSISYSLASRRRFYRY